MPTLLIWIWIETGVDGDLVHEALVFSLLAVEAGHSAELWDEEDQFVVGVLLDDEERLVDILDRDVVVFLVVLEEGLVGFRDSVLWGLLDVDGVDSVNPVVTIVGEN